MIPRQPPPTLTTPSRIILFFINFFFFFSTIILANFLVWSESFNDFVAKTLIKDPEQRPSANWLLKVFPIFSFPFFHHPFARFLPFFFNHSFLNVTLLIQFLKMLPSLPFFILFFYRY